MEEQHQREVETKFEYLSVYPYFLLAISGVKISNYCFAARNEMIIKSTRVSSILLSIKHFLLDIRVLQMS